MNVGVLVLGDVGRSPRMQYHTLSLSKLDEVYEVYLIGSAGEACIAPVQRNPKVEHRLLRPHVPIRSLLPTIFFFQKATKVLRQVFQLFSILLFDTPRLEYIVVQNPPCIPTFFVVRMMTWLRGTRMVIDWHNLGYSVLALSLNNDQHHWLVRLAKWYEKFFARYADAHISVTAALKGFLVQEFDLEADKIHVMYDKPPSFFHPRSLPEQHILFQKLGSDLFGEQSEAFSLDHTPFTRVVYGDEVGEDGEKIPENVVAPEDKPFLIVSSTSWTPDEDFGILLSALKFLDRKIRREKTEEKFTKILCIVTGKGPMKAQYEEEMSNLVLEHVSIRTMWLETEDYPALLGSADLGVCLHTSTSGLDLPMKVVDMFGSGLPVCAVHYNCIDELVKHEVNGLVFKGHIELGEQLYLLAQKDSHTLTKLQKGVNETCKERWQEQWDRQLKPLLSTLRVRPASATFRFIKFSFIILLLAYVLSYFVDYRAQLS